MELISFEFITLIILTSTSVYIIDFVLLTNRIMVKSLEYKCRKEWSSYPNNQDYRARLERECSSSRNTCNATPFMPATRARTVYKWNNCTVFMN